MFLNYKLQKTHRSFGNTTYTNTVGFGQTVSTNTFYFISDYITGNLIMYNDQWVYQTYATFPFSLSYMTGIGPYLYITFNNEVIKINESMAILATYSYTGAWYRGIVYSNNFLYVASVTLKRVDVFDPINLIFQRSICTGTNNEWYSIAAYGNTLYVASYFQMMIYTNEVYAGTTYPASSNICGTNVLESLLVDSFGVIALSCSNYQLLAFSWNGQTLSSVSSISLIGIGGYSFQIGVDSNNRLILVGDQQVSILY